MNKNLEIFNEWWLKGKINSYRVGKNRTLLEKIFPYLKKRQAILLIGLRRVGKTTLFYQIINNLLQKKISPFNIFYLSFDDPEIEMENSLNWYFSEILKGDIKKKVYIFFDEVHKAKNWENIIKKYYDLYPNLKFFITGSASLISLKGARESLAGRVFTFQLEQLSFNEFLNFKNVKYDEKRIAIFSQKLNKEFKHYLLSGGFPELTNENNYEIIKNYIKEMVFERIIYRDIPATFKVKEPELLLRLLKIISANPGMLLDYKSLSSDLKRDWRTIENYLGYLEKTFLIKVLKNFSKNLLTSEKKLKKFYAASTSFSTAIDYSFLEREDLLGKLVETLLVKEGRFFYRTPHKQEVDLIRENNKEILPIEIKYKTKLIKKDYAGLIHFLRKFKLKKGVIVTKDFKNILKINSYQIYCVPVLEWIMQ